MSSGIKIISILLGVSLLLGLRLATLRPDEENSMDAFYHAAMADLGPSVYTSKKFPTLTMSAWRWRFSDKELTFHLILSVERRFSRWLGLPTAPPFNLEYLPFAFFLVGTFVLALSHFKIDNMPIYVLAFVGLAPFLITRLPMLRPHIPAMSLVLLACVCFDGIRDFRHLWIPALFGFVMSWSYSNPHFILLPAFIYALRAMRSNWRFALAIPVAAIAGIVFGLTLHPQFPNTFLNWKIQCVDVVLASFSNSLPVKLGYEIAPGNLNFLLSHWVFAVLAAFNVSSAAFILISTWKRNKVSGFPFSELSDEEALTVAFSIASLLSFVGLFLAIRAVEYAVPISLIATGMNLRQLNLSGFWKRDFLKSAFIQVCLVVLVSCLALFNLSRYCRAARKVPVRPARKFSRWLSHSGIPRFSVIGNLNWSDFPILFYASPDYRYLAGVDPMFAYSAHPNRMLALELFRTGAQALTPPQLYQVTKARFVFVSKRNARLAADMYKLGFVAVYQGRDGDLFDLTLSQSRMRGNRTNSIDAFH